MTWQRSASAGKSGRTNIRMLEREVESRLGAVLRKNGFLFLKWVSPGVSGVPDRIAISPTGRITFVELKTDTGRLSEVQKIMIGKLRKRECDVVVLHGFAECMTWAEEVINREIHTAPISGVRHPQDRK